MQSKANGSKAKATTAMKRPRGVLYTTVAHTIIPAKEGLADCCFYIDSGASGHLILSKGDLRSDSEFGQPVEIDAANGGKTYPYRAGNLCQECSTQRSLAPQYP